MEQSRELQESEMFYSAEEYADSFEQSSQKSPLKLVSFSQQEIIGIARALLTALNYQKTLSELESETNFNSIPQDAPESIAQIVEEGVDLKDILASCERYLQTGREGRTDRKVEIMLQKYFSKGVTHTLPKHVTMRVECQPPIECMSIAWLNGSCRIVLLDSTRFFQVVKDGVCKRKPNRWSDVKGVWWVGDDQFMVALATGKCHIMKELFEIDSTIQCGVQEISFITYLHSVLFGQSIHRTIFLRTLNGPEILLNSEQRYSELLYSPPYLIGVQFKKQSIYKIDVDLDEEGMIYRINNGVILSVRLKGDQLMVLIRERKEHSILKMTLNGQILMRYEFQESKNKLKIADFFLFGELILYSEGRRLHYYSMLSERTVYVDTYMERVEVVEIKEGQGIMLLRGQQLELISVEERELVEVEVKRRQQFMSIDPSRRIPEGLMLLLRTIRENNPQILNML